MTKAMTCRVDEDVKHAFGAYARLFGLRDSELARLLIARERTHRQLAEFLAVGGEVRSPISRVPEPPKITAHFSSETAAAEFDAYAANCHLTRDRAAGWLLERELAERWLEKAMALSPSALPIETDL